MNLFNGAGNKIEHSSHYLENILNHSYGNFLMYLTGCLPLHTLKVNL
jgi:hypothetical protein